MNLINQKTPLDYALYWQEMGVAPFPVHWKDKKPACRWASYRDILPTKKQIRDWFKDSVYNVGIACGGMNNLVVLDFDDYNYYEKFMKEFDSDFTRNISMTHKVKTRRGIHVYFFTTKREDNRHSQEWNIDIQSYGKYVLTTPSIHPSGSIYRNIDFNGVITIENLDIIKKDLVEFEPTSIELPQKSKSWLDNIYMPDTRTDTRYQEILERYPIHVFVEQFSKLERTSSGFFIAKCMCHNDKNPSLSVNPKHNTVKCFSSSCTLSDKWRNIIQLYTKVHNCNTTQAIEALYLHL